MMTFRTEGFFGQQESVPMMIGDVLVMGTMRALFSASFFFFFPILLAYSMVSAQGVKHNALVPIYSCFSCDENFLGFTLLVTFKYTIEYY